MIKKTYLIIFPIITLLVYFFISQSDINTDIPTQPNNQSSLTPTQIIQKLPSSHLIKTSFVPQAPEKNWDQPWQDACEEAALLTSVYYLSGQTPSLSQIKQDILDILEYENSQSWQKDINLSQISQIAGHHFNLKADIHIDPTIDDIKKYISGNQPVMITGNGKILYRENKHFKDGGPLYHALTILGYNDKKREFTVHDVGTQYGAYFTYSYNTLMESIHDLPPSADKHDIDMGQKAILLISRV